MGRLNMDITHFFKISFTHLPCTMLLSRVPFQYFLYPLSIFLHIYVTCFFYFNHISPSTVSTTLVIHLTHIFRFLYFLVLPNIQRTFNEQNFEWTLDYYDLRHRENRIYANEKLTTSVTFSLMYFFHKNVNRLPFHSRVKMDFSATRHFFLSGF